jgi:hypothetical protein
VAVIEARVAVMEGRVEEQGKMWQALRDDMVRIEERIDRRFDVVEQRFAAVDRRFDAMEAQMDRRFDAMDAKMSRQFMWLAGILVTTLAALSTAVLSR